MGTLGDESYLENLLVFFQGMPEPVAYLGRIQDMNIKHGQSELYGVM